jgi:hypothetical protein
LTRTLVPFQQAEAIQAQLLEVVPQHALDGLVLAWHHDHLNSLSHAKQKRYHQKEREAWLAFAEGLLSDECEPLTALVFEKLDSIVRASALVEMVNSFIRPYLHSCKGHLTQEALNLMMFYHNHRRYNSGKRKGKAPIELLTGHPLEAEWVELLSQQVHREQDAKDDGALPSQPPLQLMVHNDARTDQSATPPSQAILDCTAASEALRQHTYAAAA